MTNTCSLCFFLLIGLLTLVNSTRFTLVKEDGSTVDEDFDKMSVIFYQYKTDFEYTPGCAEVLQEIKERKQELAKLRDEGEMDEDIAQRTYAEYFFDHLEDVFEVIGLELTIYDRDYHDISL